MIVNFLFCYRKYHLGYLTMLGLLVFMVHISFNGLGKFFCKIISYIKTFISEKW